MKLTEHNSQEARWIACPEPLIASRRLWTILSGQGRKFKFGIPQEIVQVVRDQDGATYRIVNNARDYTITKWEQLDA